jgi:hypothetical protein
VRRIALAVVAGLLMLSASGASAMVVPEPCAGYEQAGREDGDCPPTCVTCGCCAQAAEPVMLRTAISPDAPVAVIHARRSSLPQARARDILHVPKSVLA